MSLHYCLTCGYPNQSVGQPDKCQSCGALFSNASVIKTIPSIQEQSQRQMPIIIKQSEEEDYNQNYYDSGPDEDGFRPGFDAFGAFDTDELINVFLPRGPENQGEKMSVEMPKITVEQKAKRGRKPKVVKD